MARESKPNRALRRRLLEQQRALLAASVQIEATQVERTTTVQHSGPLPTPDFLAGYNQVQPGLADRIVKMAEEEAAHRRSLEKTIVEAQALDVRDGRMEARIGQILAALVAVTLIISGAVCIVKDHPLSGLFLEGATLVTLVGVFIRGRSSKQQQTTQTSEGEASTPKEPESKIEPSMDGRLPTEQSGNEAG